LVPWWLAAGGKNLASASFANLIMSTKRGRQERVLLGGIEWDGDEEYCKCHGNVKPLVFEEMKPGWDDSISKRSSVEAGGLHPKTAQFIRKVHVVLLESMAIVSVDLYMSHMPMPEILS
jgi:hypothetical protein